MELQEYIINYVKYKDAIKQSLQHVERKKDHVLFTFKNEKIPYYTCEKLADAPKSFASPGKNYIVCLNTKENAEYLIQNWKQYAAIKHLIIIFANIKQHEQWLINTHIHARCTDEKAIKEGILSLFATVSQVV